MSPLLHVGDALFVERSSGIMKGVQEGGERLQIINAQRAGGLVGHDDAEGLTCAYERRPRKRQLFNRRGRWQLVKREGEQLRLDPDQVCDAMAGQCVQRSLGLASKYLNVHCDDHRGVFDQYSRCDQKAALAVPCCQCLPFLQVGIAITLRLKLSLGCLGCGVGEPPRSAYSEQGAYKLRPARQLVVRFHPGQRLSSKAAKFHDRRPPQSGASSPRLRAGRHPAHTPTAEGAAQ